MLQLPVEVLELIAPALVADFLQHAQAGPDQVEVQRIRPLLEAQVARAVLHVADALDRQRVGPQVGRGRAFVQARALLQPAEERLQAAPVEAGVHQGDEADAIGLALGVAREVELLLDRGRLPTHDRGLRQVAARRSAGARREYRQQQRADLDRHGVLLRGQHARDVTLRDVADFVCDHARQLGLRLGRDDEARMDADEAAGQRERVEHRIAHEEEAEVDRARRADRNQLVAELVQVFGRFRVGQVVRVAPDLGHDLLAELALQAGRQFFAAGFAQRRQFERLRARRQRRGSAEREGHQQYKNEADQVHGRQLGATTPCSV